MIKAWIMRKLGLLLLGVWLIVTGILELGVIKINGIAPLMAILAIAAGILILLGR